MTPPRPLASAAPLPSRRTRATRRARMVVLASLLAAGLTACQPHGPVTTSTGTTGATPGSTATAPAAPPSSGTGAAGATPTSAGKPTSVPGGASHGGTKTPQPPSSAGGGSGTMSDAVGQVLALINRARAAQGLAPYTLTPQLDRSAAAHDKAMDAGCGLTHQCAGESALGARESAAGVAWSSCGENIGQGGPVATDAAAQAAMAVRLTQAMLDEKPPNDGHRRNILSSQFRHIGIAVTRDASGTVWLTQDFSN